MSHSHNEVQGAGHYQNLTKVVQEFLAIDSAFAPSRGNRGGADNGDVLEERRGNGANRQNAIVETILDERGEQVRAFEDAFYV